ncbi:MAG: diguanylate cyclase (GGDEF)-like protein [Planctomycetota bacterium]|jgi:diguanylate cyclase (GGDEF)-like protein
MRPPYSIVLSISGQNTFIHNILGRSGPNDPRSLVLSNISLDSKEINRILKNEPEAPRSGGPERQKKDMSNGTGSSRGRSHVRPPRTRGSPMTERREIVVLSDPEAHILEATEKLRAHGWRVHVTHRPFEAALFMVQHKASALFLREHLLDDNIEDFLRQIRELDHRPFTIVGHYGHNAALERTNLVDCLLMEPVTFSDLRDALEFEQNRPEDVVEIPAPTGAKFPSHGFTQTKPIIDHGAMERREQIVRACCTLSELERDRELLLTQALEFFMDVTEATRASLMLLDESHKHLEIVRRQGFPRHAPSPIKLKLGEDLAGTVCVRGEPLLFEADSRAPSSSTRGYLGTSFLVIPLKCRATTIGVINLTNKRGGTKFTQEDLHIAMMLADQTAITLSNADTFADLHAMTVIDPLTHLYNRRHFDRELKKELERARRYGRRLTLALLDIDNFKLFNDINGYVTGDAIIKQVGLILQDNFREVDIVTRWGGDEFAVLLPDTGSPGGPGTLTPGNFIERVRTAVDGANFRETVPEAAGRITLSAGVATYPLDCRNEAELFREANLALARAKKEGNNRTCYARDNTDDDTLESELGD